MAIDLVPIIRNNRKTYAAVDEDTGFLNVVFTQFIGWLSLGKLQGQVKSRGLYPTTLTLRAYSYRLKRWFDYIFDWNQTAPKEYQISWKTAQNKHMQLFLSKLDELDPRTRNGLRIVWAMFYDVFCPFMGYTHTMTGLTSFVETDNFQAEHMNSALLGGTKDKKSGHKTVLLESEKEKLTYPVASLENIAILLKNFDDVVYNHFSYFMFTTGLRIGGALQLPYPNTDKNNIFITSPEILRSDYKISNFFTFSYIYKGHEVIGDLYPCDVPLYAWEDIWTNYRPLVLGQDEKSEPGRLDLWRARMIEKTGDKGFAKRFPKSFWLDKDGKEITAQDVWKAFRDCRKKIVESGHPYFPDFVPQMLRHSYATWMVICFAEAQGIPLDPSDKSALEAIHQYMQDQLGHSQRSTTLKYIWTAARVVKKRWLPQIMPRRLPDGTIVAGLGPEQLSTFQRVVNFDGFMNSLNEELQSGRK